MKRIYQAGMTLVEIMVVLFILVALAGVGMPYVGGAAGKALCEATDVTMANVKRAIMDGYYVDMLGKFPQNLKGLSMATGSPKYNLHFLFSDKGLDLVGADGIENSGDERFHKLYDPSSAIGWRNGGYLQSGVVLQADMGGTFAKTTTDASGITTNDYTSPLKEDHVVVMDGWSRPIVLQVLKLETGVPVDGCKKHWNVAHPYDAYCARLVSAGPRGGIGLGNGYLDTRIKDDFDTIVDNEARRQEDDRILYLNSATPLEDVNPPCQ